MAHTPLFLIVKVGKSLKPFFGNSSLKSILFLCIHLSGGKSVYMSGEARGVGSLGAGITGNWDSDVGAGNQTLVLSKSSVYSTIEQSLQHQETAF